MKRARRWKCPSIIIRRLCPIISSRLRTSNMSWSALWAGKYHVASMISFGFANACTRPTQGAPFPQCQRRRPTAHLMAIISTIECKYSSSLSIPSWRCLNCAQIPLSSVSWRPITKYSRKPSNKGNTSWPNSQIRKQLHPYGVKTY